jgi:hypothetical protein
LVNRPSPVQLSNLFSLLAVFNLLGIFSYLEVFSWLGVLQLPTGFMQIQLRLARTLLHITVKSGSFL